jgi:hypothetical protein
MSEQYEGRQFVGMDLHRRRSVLVRMTEAGERLETIRIVNDVDRLAAVMARAGEAPEVVLEATYGGIGPPMGSPRSARRRILRTHWESKDSCARSVPCPSVTQSREYVPGAHRRARRTGDEWLTLGSRRRQPARSCPASWRTHSPGRSVTAC